MITAHFFDGEPKHIKMKRTSNLDMILRSLFCGSMKLTDLLTMTDAKRPISSESAYAMTSPSLHDSTCQKTVRSAIADICILADLHNVDTHGINRHANIIAYPIVLNDCVVRLPGNI